MKYITNYSMYLAIQKLHHNFEKKLYSKMRPVLSQVHAMYQFV
jgi:hypothetical protein